jgi:hypothetical protein
MRSLRALAPLGVALAAVPADYQAATQRIHHSAKNASHLELLVDAR